jgi:hypothetical protein
LAELLNVLSTSPGPYLRFIVTTAHRSEDPAADVENFKFFKDPKIPDLNVYDEIWIFGVVRGRIQFDGHLSVSEDLSEDELKALAQFMDGGGGIFAAGDHEDLGLQLCGQIPRVSSMRKWYWNKNGNPGPNGEPSAPGISGFARHDTLRPGHDIVYDESDQSDDVPQMISPKEYWPYPELPVFWRHFPHPLLCGPRGIIRVLPDHMHEGECYVPSDLKRSFTFAGYNTKEYPDLPSGEEHPPEVIAWATVLGGRTSPSLPEKPGPVNPKTFGVIGAYDGHQTNIGRVVVDATWHHFFNVNLKGDRDRDGIFGPNDIKSKGFYYSEAGLAAYEDIKAYFRNIAVWLARKDRIACMEWHALWAPMESSNTHRIPNAVLWKGSCKIGFHRNRPYWLFCTRCSWKASVTML